jgi:hypothetical protein
MNAEQEILVKRLKEAGFDTRRFLKLNAEKAAFEKDWPSKLYTPEEMGDHPYWGICGRDGLVLVDADKAAMESILRKILPPTFEVKSPRRGLPHFFYVVEGEPVPNKTLHLKGEEEGCGEIRAQNEYLVAAGTEIHYKDLKTSEPKIGRYIITQDRPFAKIQYADFMKAVEPYFGKDSTQKITFKQMREGVPQGTRHAQGIKYATFLAGVQQFDCDTALVEMRRWNQLNQPPMDDSDLIRMVENAAGYVAANFKQPGDNLKNRIFSPPPRGGYISEDATKPMSLDDVEEVLSLTLKRDYENKRLVFLSMLMNYSGDDQQNILFNAPSATGKSYIALEIAKLFPAEDVDKKGYTSPTAFFHVMGKLCRLNGEPLEDRNAYVESKLDEWEEKHPHPSAPDYNDKSAEAIKARHALSEWKTLRKSEYCKHKEEWDGIEKIHVVNLEKRILIFKDQPHDRVLQVLRSMLSHDEKVLEVDITDKTKEGGHRTKKIRVIGFPTVVFCSAAFSLNEQERTRFTILSPDMSQEKLNASLKLQAQRLSDKEKFETELNINEKRTLLMQRIQAIKASNVNQVVIPQNLADTLLTWFTKERDLSSRDQRDFPRLIDLVKAHALFQMFQREKAPGSCSVIANKEDVAAAQKLLNKVLEANRLGLPPYVHKFYSESLEPSITEDGITREKFSKLYFAQFKERLGEKARKQLIDLLSDAGLIEEAPDPDDKRRMKIYIPHERGEQKIKICGQCLNFRKSACGRDGWANWNGDTDTREYLCFEPRSEPNKEPVGTRVKHVKPGEPCEMCKTNAVEYQIMGPEDHTRMCKGCFSQLRANGQQFTIVEDGEVRP